ncbi:TldD/PmbA family protein [Waterburya agarophytonicola K14]|uniref:TldD/PmbA family protein n=1 Tax=Waterburya agarophytonicola KI4 TaxID=2874699 RepID=A0A964BX17_9CYAN|nr:TldD/PmbA family protein [Waterburya agarophytonicola]MCC0179648.1 TldD/PmbA family protein [Waterburya agarophytonicola KI4]
MPELFAEHKNRLTELIEVYSDRVDFLTIRLEQAEETNIFLRSSKIETLSESIALGGQVRACYRGGWGFAAFNDLDTLIDRIEEAIAAAKTIGESETILAEVAPIQTVCQVPLKGSDPRTISLTDKKALCDRYDRLLREYHDCLTATTVSYSDSSQKIIIANSEGSAIEQSWTDLEMRFSATARKGDLIQTGRETTGSRQGYEDLTDLDSQVIGAAQRAVDALTLPKIKGDTYTVVIDPILTGLFVHEAFGHLSEADMAYENPDLLEVMSMGKRFGSDELQIFDGAAPLEAEDQYIHRGSYFYDDEGTPATTTQLIKDGVLVGRLHSRETAGKLGEKPTGNARCLNYQYSPIVRMTNTWIARGKTPVKELFEDIGEGVYARNWLGGMTNGEMFTFSAGEAWMIRHGKLAEPVKDVTLSGNVFKTLANIEAIGDDFYWDESGGCGKGGQSGLAVGCGGPSLRIKDVTIGGS